MNIVIEEPKKDTIEFAHHLESEYSNLEKYGEKDGFFIKAEDLSLYFDLAKEDCIRIAISDDTPIGQSVVIPPNHSIMHRLFQSNAMIFFDNIDVQPDNCCWIAKIAVSRIHKNKGVGSKLVCDIEKRFSGHNILTTTALTPRMNFAIEGLMKKNDYKRVGVWLGGKENEHTCNIIWHKKLID